MQNGINIPLVKRIMNTVEALDTKIADTMLLSFYTAREKSHVGLVEKFLEIN